MKARVVIELVSKAYFAYLFLEDSSGRILHEHNSGGIGRTSRLVHRTHRTGIYRIIATSQDGVRSGPFSLSLRVKGR